MNVTSFCEKDSQPHNDRNLASEPTVSQYFHKFHTGQLESMSALLHASIGDQWERYASLLQFLPFFHANAVISRMLKMLLFPV